MPLKVSPMVYAFPLQEVRLLDGPFRAAMERSGRWMESLEPDRFLAWFRKEAGLPQKGEAYGGWERATIAGPSLGHYLSGCAMRYAATGDAAWAQRVTYIVDELATCQEAHGDGYLIPPELTRGKSKVRLKFAAAPGRIAGRIYGVRLMGRDQAAALSAPGPASRAPGEGSRDTAKP